MYIRGLTKFFLGSKNSNVTWYSVHHVFEDSIFYNYFQKLVLSVTTIVIYTRDTTSQVDPTGVNPFYFYRLLPKQ